MSRRILTLDTLVDIGEGGYGDWFQFTTNSGESVLLQKEHDEGGAFWFKCYGRIPEELSSLEDAVVENGFLGFSYITDCVRVDFEYAQGYGTKDNPYRMIIS